MTATPLQFYKSVQSALRAKTGKTLGPLLKRWRYTQSSDYAELSLRPGSLRFLARYGSLDAGKDAQALAHDYHELLVGISRASGDAPGVVAAWLELFASGEYGVLQDGLCGPEPACSECALKERCRYLAAGGKDSRAFGASLSEELLRASRAQPPDLRNADLLAFVMSGEKAGAADIARAEALLKACNGLRGVFLAGAERLSEAGLSAAAAARLQAAGELCRRWAEEKDERGKQFAGGKDFFEHFHLRLRDLKREVFYAVLLDQRNCLIAEEQVSAGSLTEALVHPREVFAAAIARRAAAVALVHNHPSGDPSPSSADKLITKRLQDVARLCGIRLLDHVIVGDGVFVSFVEKGLF